MCALNVKSWGPLFLKAFWSFSPFFATIPCFSSKVGAPFFALCLDCTLMGVRALNFKSWGPLFKGMFGHVCLLKVGAPFVPTCAA